ncbi:glycosyltransferase [Pararcticibacter amylolyticus]|uniref:Uncharacterized protein n=1 Tax=Pararcticibacter amylolyticus TaxID=2173175 RepID=A0A2U2PLN1_9SPHI|nr:glycosyltransferase [Pararcticibacter amylolyticus]PWG82172.1 hypothetical protein DDR33_03930 [Pararcticibacter amylolyticus]
MSWLSPIWTAVQIIIGYNLVLPVLLFILWLIFKRRGRSGRIDSSFQPDYAIILTAYEQTHTIPAAVNSILNLHYRNFLLYIVADNCDVSGLSFDDEKVIILRPPMILQSNTRSHFYAISHFQRNHTHLTIIDSDNLVDPGYLDQLNIYFNNGFEAVQGVRNAKNLNSVYACLDAARDIYYHFYDGRILFGLGSSATLAGSGMAFTTELYAGCLQHLDVQGAGFDKVLQNEILKKGKRIAFAEKAIVYDEKTSRSDQLVNQRSRWINTWFRYFSFGFGLITRGITRFNLNQFLFGLILLRPPLFIFLLLSFVCLLVDLFISPVHALLWAVAFMVFTCGFAISLISSETDKKIYDSLIAIPKFIYFQIVSLIYSRKANKRSVATKHYHPGMENKDRTTKEETNED